MHATQPPYSEEAKQLPRKTMCGNPSHHLTWGPSWKGTQTPAYKQVSLHMTPAPASEPSLVIMSGGKMILLPSLAAIADPWEIKKKKKKLSLVLPLNLGITCYLIMDNQDRLHSMNSSAHSQFREISTFTNDYHMSRYNTRTLRDPHMKMNVHTYVCTSWFMQRQFLNTLKLMVVTSVEQPLGWRAISSYVLSLALFIHILTSITSKTV